MKKHILNLVGLITVLTAAQPILAEGSLSAGSTSSMTIETAAPERLGDYGLALNPQIGSSSFEYTGKDKSSNDGLSGGLTVEFGRGMRKFETGLVLVQMAKSGYLTIPMMAKVRLFSMRAQSYYAKLGFAAAFEAVNRKQEASNYDVLAGLGVGGRLALGNKIAFIIEGTFHQGMVNAYSNRSNDIVRNQGFLILSGLSFSI